MMEPGASPGVFARSLAAQSCWSFERMQALGFSLCLAPRLEKIWGPEQGRLALLRYQGYFNTHPYFIPMIAGVVCGLEEEIAAAPEAERPAKRARLDALKAASASALAAIGDKLFWRTWLPLCAAAALQLTLTSALRHGRGWWLAPLAFLAIYNVPALWLRFNGFAVGYRLKDRLPKQLEQWRSQFWIKRLRGAGTVLALALVARFLARPPLGGERVGGIIVAALYIAAARFFPARATPARAYALIFAALMLGRLAGLR